MPSSSVRRRNAPVAVIVVLAVLAVALVVISVLYFARNAGALPSFFPGHQAGSTRHHTKHGIAALALAVACLVGAWISTGRRASTA